jgi:hypothetical protein
MTHDESARIPAEPLMTAGSERTGVMFRARYGRRGFLRPSLSLGLNEVGARYAAMAMVVADREREREDRSVRSASGGGSKYARI